MSMFNFLPIFFSPFISSKYKEKINADNTSDRIEFYGIVFSSRLKIMALTGNRQLKKYTEKRLSQDYLNWSQAKGKNPHFMALAKATDRKAMIMRNETTDEIANKINEFITLNYISPSKPKSSIKAKLNKADLSKL